MIINMWIFRRVEFKRARVGCCGLVRNDSITPVGYDVNASAFQKEACTLMERYGKQSYDGDGDEYSLEYFEGESPDQNLREDGPSLFKFVLKGKKWQFFDHGKIQFSVASLKELKKIWQH